MEHIVFVHDLFRALTPGWGVNRSRVSNPDVSESNGAIGSGGGKLGTEKLGRQNWGLVDMLTRKQYELLRFISERLKESGVPPSFDEMKDALDLRSKSGIHRLITALEERGFIRRLPNRARAIEVIKLPELSGNGNGNGNRRGFTPSVIEGTLGRVRSSSVASDDDGGTRALVFEAHIQQQLPHPDGAAPQHHRREQEPHDQDAIRQRDPQSG